MSKHGLILSGAYILIALYFILTQGLFGESFIAIILGLPWSLIFSFFEYWGTEGILVYLLLLAPIGLNAYLLYKLGCCFRKKNSL